MLNLNNIPLDLNAELLFDWLPEGSFRFSLRGQHKRNAYNDLVEIERSADNSYIFHLGRNGLYNALPEYLFHSLDRFSNLPPLEEKERFAEEMAKQEKERENAMQFFEPVDLLLMLYRIAVRRKQQEVTESDTLLSAIIADRLSDSQKRNRFIRKTLPFMPSCRNIRGNTTLLAQLLRKVLMEEGLKVTPANEPAVWEDAHPRYCESLGEELDATFVGNVFDEDAVHFKIEYVLDSLNADFPALLEELDEYRRFVGDFFLSVEDVLVFSVSGADNEIILGQEDIYNYLNYNTSI